MFFAENYMEFQKTTNSLERYHDHLNNLINKKTEK